MHQPYLPGEARQEAPHSLRGEGNLGHQNDGLFAHAQRSLHRLEIDLGFARAGNAM
jgi:hypothetical protein